MSMLEYARREVELARLNGKKHLECFEFEYIADCYDSALKAFESLIDDGHSGQSIRITKYILNRLIDGKPLTPIEDTNDIWNDVSYDKKNQYTTYQCSRMSSLFKKVYEDGTIKYNDISSFHCVDVNTGSTYHSSLAQDIVNEMYPVTMPYTPTDIPIKIYCEDFLTDPKNGDFDTKGLLYLVNPEGVKFIIDRYFKEGLDGQWIEIEAKEYIDRSRESDSRKEGKRC